jgi:hypothetical protein
MGAAQTARWSGDTSGHTRFCRMLMWHSTSGRVSDASGWLLYRFKNRFLSLAAAPHFYFSRFFSYVFVFLVCFSRVFSRVLDLFCRPVHFISFSGILLHLLHYFHFYLTVNLFNILEYSKAMPKV